MILWSKSDPLVSLVHAHIKNKTTEKHCSVNQKQFFYLVIYLYRKCISHIVRALEMLQKTQDADALVKGVYLL